MNTRALAFMICGVGFSASSMQTASAWDEGESHNADGRRSDLSAFLDGAGIGVFSTTPHGVKLLKGSPFLPAPIPTGFAGDTPGPSFFAENPKQTHVYSLYQFIFGPADLLVSFKLTPEGLKQEESRTVGFENAGPHNPAGVYIMGASDHYVYIVGMNNYGPIDLTRLELYGFDNGHFTTSWQMAFHDIDGPNVSNETPPEAIHIDADEQFLYACFPNGELVLDESKANPFVQMPPSVAVYHLNNGVPTLVVNSTNAQYLALKCPQ